LLSLLETFATSGLVLVNSVQQLRLALESSDSISVQSDLTFSAKDWPQEVPVTIAEGRHVVVSGAGATSDLWPLIDFIYLYSRVTLSPSSTLTFTHFWLFHYRLALATAFPGEWWRRVCSCVCV
jgi:hypothetical protein